MSNKLKTVKVMVPVKGLRYRLSDRERSDLRDSANDKGVVCELELEPENEYDPRAIKVLAIGKHIGYVARPVNVPLYRTIKAGLKIKTCKMVEYDKRTDEGRLEVLLYK